MDSCIHWSQKMGKDNRPNWDEYFINMAIIASSRGSCLRRKVGCVLVNSRNQILSTGYNGKASGITNCSIDPCEGAYSPSGTNLDKCQAIHAETNALLQCPNVYEIAKAYVTVSPCITCVKMFLNTGCQEIIFLDDYSHPDSSEIWMKANRIWRKLDV